MDRAVPVPFSAGESEGFAQHLCFRLAPGVRADEAGAEVVGGDDGEADSARRRASQLDLEIEVVSGGLHVVAKISPLRHTRSTYLFSR